MDADEAPADPPPVETAADAAQAARFESFPLPASPAPLVPAALAGAAAGLAVFIGLQALQRRR